MSSLKPPISDWLNITILTYIVMAYSIGITLLLQSSWGLNGLGFLLLIHSLVLSAAATHELIHGNLFKQRWANGWAGRLMTHLNGACYAPYENLVQHHLNHHIHHADFVPFEIVDFFKTLPQPLLRFCTFLEWAYFPLFEFVLRGRMMVMPFMNSDTLDADTLDADTLDADTLDADTLDAEKAHLRGRTLLLMAYRGSLFALLGWASPKALILYAVAYICFVNLMRFVDAFHHTYDYVVMGADIPKRDRTYEQAHTFSNLVSARYPWLNLLYLNFGYHNAHHHDMRCPWYSLPQLHTTLYGDQAKALLPLPQLIGNYHQFRLDRLFGGQGVVANGSDELAAFTGGIGVSFLTPP
ncbi:MAG: fatty acid desaturase [Cyanobacteria bacterium P01_E01_bin.6]